MDGWITSWNQNCLEKYQQPQIWTVNHSNGSNGRKQRGIKEPLDEGERGEWKSWLKTQHSKNEDHGIQSHHFMVNRCGKEETRTDFIFLDSKITVDSDCSHDIKSGLLLGRKAMTNLDSISKSRDITLLTKVNILKAPIHDSNSHVWMWELDPKESWTLKN